MQIWWYLYNEKKEKKKKKNIVKNLSKIEKNKQAQNHRITKNNKVFSEN